MFTEQEYLYGWLAYLAGVVLVMGCGWLLTARLKWSWLRNLLRVVVGAALLVPWYASPELEFVAPAWIIASFEGIFEGDFWRAGAPLLAGVGVAVLLYIVVATIVYFVRKPASEGNVEVGAKETSRATSGQ